VAEEDKRWKLDTEIGESLYRIIEGYARVQGITMGSLVRQQLSDSFKNELTNMQGHCNPKIVKKDWK